MSLIQIDAAQLRAQVHFSDLIGPVAQAFQEFSAGQGKSELVVMYPNPSVEDGDVYVKTGLLHGHSVYIVKISPWFKANVTAGQPQGGFIAVFDSSTGHTLALLDDEHYLSDIRTAAAGALAARHLAPTTATTAAVLGSGVQAYWQSLALYHERPFAHLSIWARDQTKAHRLAEQLSRELPANVKLAVSSDLEHTVRSCDVLITATSSRDPLVNGDWLHEGQHITAVGADDPSKCELDASVLRRANVFVDSRAASMANGDLSRAIREGGLRTQRNRRRGRRTPLRHGPRQNPTNRHHGRQARGHRRARPGSRRNLAAHHPGSTRLERSPMTSDRTASEPAVAVVKNDIALMTSLPAWHPTREHQIIP